jgi:hypothetical protein
MNRFIVTVVVPPFKLEIFVVEKATGTCCESQTVVDKIADEVNEPCTVMVTLIAWFLPTVEGV